MAERPPSVPPRLRAAFDQGSPFWIEPRTADLKQWLSEEDRIDLFKARQYDLKADLQSNASGNGDSEFDRAWVETGEEEERSNPFSGLDPQDKETAETIHCRRKSIAKRIVNLEDEALAGLAQRDAKARHEARNMLRAYYQ